LRSPRRRPGVRQGWGRRAARPPFSRARLPGAAAGLRHSAAVQAARPARSTSHPVHRRPRATLPACLSCSCRRAFTGARPKWCGR